MYDHIVDWELMFIIPLQSSSPCIPNLYRVVFRARDHPFALMLKCNASDVVSVSFESHDGIWVGGFDIVESDDMSACSS